ncbi:MAG: hypothetical protein AB7S65_03080 [Sulfuricurvum sp.]
MRKTIALMLGLTVGVSAEPYELGRGIQVDPALNVGAYFSTEYASDTKSDTATLEDLAVLGYGDINPMLSYLAELESVGFYTKNLTDGSEDQQRTFRIERLYGDLWLSDDFNVRFGKMITPIGYWNLEPINVLRDTTSNPLYATLLFPRFLTGININGYVPGCEGVRYNVFGQNNHDFDDEYINIPNTHFFGLSIEKEVSSEAGVGGSIGEYITMRSGERSRFVQANARYDDGEWVLSTEGIVSKTEYQSGVERYTTAGYAQVVYRFNSQHALVGRYEYYDRRFDGYTDQIGVVGYSYRPVYPVSLKGEYQWHSQSDENRFLVSFSVLF